MPFGVGIAFTRRPYSDSSPPLRPHPARSTAYAPHVTTSLCPPSQFRRAQAFKPVVGDGINPEGYPPSPCPPLFTSISSMLRRHAGPPYATRRSQPTVSLALVPPAIPPTAPPQVDDGLRQAIIHAVDPSPLWDVVKKAMPSSPLDLP